MSRGFTGRHMLGVMLAMFGTIIAVNFVMASYAVTTFGGTVVDNSYVATSRYNDWLAEARTQKLRGWRIETGLDGDRRMRVVVRSSGGLVAGSVRAVARHPLGRAPDRPLTFERAKDGAYVATQPLPNGRWLLNLVVTSGTSTGRFEAEVAT